MEILNQRIFLSARCEIQWYSLLLGGDEIIPQFLYSQQCSVSMLLMIVHLHTNLTQGIFISIIWANQIYMYLTCIYMCIQFHMQYFHEYNQSSGPSCEVGPCSHFTDAKTVTRPKPVVPKVWAALGNLQECKFWGLSPDLLGQQLWGRAL